MRTKTWKGESQDDQEQKEDSKGVTPWLSEREKGAGPDLRDRKKCCASELRNMDGQEEWARRCKMPGGTEGRNGRVGSLGNRLSSHQERPEKE